MNITTRIELAFGADLTANPATWVWTDVSVFALGSVRRTFGRKDEATRTQPASTTFRLRNTDGRFSPRFPTSPYYPNVRRQTPVRIGLNPGTGYVQRFQGYVDEITPVWPAGNSEFAEVAVTASGSLRRLGQGQAPIRSALRRSFDVDPVRPVAYWPLEGGKDGTVLYDAISNAPTEQVDQSSAIAGQSGAVKFGVASLGDGSDAVPNIAGSWTLGMKMPQPLPAGTGSVSAQFHIAFGTAVRSGGTVVTGLRLNPSPALRHLTWQIYCYDDKTCQIDVIEAFSDFSVAAGPTTVATGLSLGNIFDGLPRAFQLDLTASGGTNVAWTLWMNGATLASGTLTPSFSGAMNAAPYRIASGSSAIDALSTVAVGHYAVFTSIVPATRYDALNAHRGEVATDRMTRLCAEQGVLIAVVGTGDDRMGSQIPATFLSLLRECEAVDGGILYDGESAGLTYLTRDARCSLPVSLALDCLRDQVKLPFTPTEDDQQVRNDWTVSRPGGGSARFVDEAHVAANGRYDSSITLNVASDDDLRDQAAWLVSVRVLRNQIDHEAAHALVAYLLGVPVTSVGFYLSSGTKGVRAGEVYGGTVLDESNIDPFTSAVIGWAGAVAAGSLFGCEHDLDRLRGLGAQYLNDRGPGSAHQAAMDLLSPPDVRVLLGKLGQFLARASHVTGDQLVELIGPVDAAILDVQVPLVGQG